jgi:hypothetical protein
VCLDIFYNVCPKHLILRRIQRNIINVHRSLCNVSLILIGLQWNKFSRHIFEEYTKYKISWKSVHRELNCSGVQTDGRTSGQSEGCYEATGAVRNFENAHKKYTLVIQTRRCLSRRDNKLLTRRQNNFASPKSIDTLWSYWFLILYLYDTVIYVVHTKQNNMT